MAELDAMRVKQAIDWPALVFCAVLIVMVSGSVAAADEPFPLTSALAASPQGVELGTDVIHAGVDDYAIHQ